MKYGLTAAEGHFIAGFIEGESHLGIVEENGGQSYGCVMSLALRDDDAALVRWLKQRTGYGTIAPIPARRTSRPQVRWTVRTHEDCGALVRLLERYELRGRKRREFEIWRAAVEIATSGIANRRVVLRRLRTQLHDVRRFRALDPGERAPAPADRETLVAYLHGLLCAEGSFSLTTSHAGVSIHLRQDDRPLLAMLAAETGLGRLRDARSYPPAQASTFWHVSKHRDVLAMAHWLSADQMRGRKAEELGPWLAGVRELRNARVTHRRVNGERMDGLIAELRAARAYRPRGQVVPDAPDRGHSEAIAALRRWAEVEAGALASQRYQAYRAEHDPSLPHRNTLARRFGSWAAALEAAGLGERAASTPALREARLVGGAEARAARAEAQRERVLATLRYGVTVHGSLPTAMQFFRWRLVEAPATPSQGTVYKLFPGGWSAVLEAYESAAASA